MRRTAVVLTFLTLVLPLASRADTIVVNKGGTISLLTTGIASHGSRLIQFNNIHSTPGHALGSVDFATGALTSGTLLGGGIFSSVGSSFTVTGVSQGVPKGVIFNGAFVGDITWTLLSGLPNKPQVYQLSGEIEGQLYNGRMVTANTTQTIYIYNHQEIKDHTGDLHGGVANFSTPEPGTLGLLGAGLIAVAIRRRVTSERVA